MKVVKWTSKLDAMHYTPSYNDLVDRLCAFVADLLQQRRLIPQLANIVVAYYNDVGTSDDSIQRLSLLRAANARKNDPSTTMALSILDVVSFENLHWALDALELGQDKHGDIRQVFCAAATHERPQVTITCEGRIANVSVADYDRRVTAFKVDRFPLLDKLSQLWRLPRLWTLPIHRQCCKLFHECPRCQAEWDSCNLAPLAHMPPPLPPATPKIVVLISTCFDGRLPRVLQSLICEYIQFGLVKKKGGIFADDEDEQTEKTPSVFDD